MTDKEQIIVDDCKVEECVNFRDEVSIDSTVLKNACSIGLWQRHYKNLEESCKMSCKCDENPDCNFKQHARKTQECEELKEKNALLESQMAFNLSEVEIKLGNEIKRSEILLKELKRFDKIKDEFREMSETLKTENDRYRKALEEIENIAVTCFMAAKYEDRPYSGQILNIINKAKGG